MSLMTLDPTGVKQVELHALAPRLETLNGVRIGVLHNVKKNAKELLSEMANVISERYEIKEIVGPELTGNSMMASSEQLDDLATRVDVVLTGLGDCGSCTGCSLHNATELEKRGIPVVAVATEPFARTAENMAKRRGFPDYRYVLVEHPLSSARPEGVRSRAEKALPEMLSILTGAD